MFARIILTARKHALTATVKSPRRNVTTPIRRKFSTDPGPKKWWKSKSLELLAKFSAFGIAVAGIGKGCGFDQVVAHYLIKSVDQSLEETFQDVIKAPLQRFNLGHHSLISNPQFESAIEECMDNPDGGVFVLWAPPQAGKTNYIEKCVARRTKNKDKYAVMVSDYAHLQCCYPNQLLTERHVEKPTCIRAALKEGQHVVFVLDAFDEAMGHFDPKSLESWVVTMAQQSQHCKKFTVLVCVRHAGNAETILSWNNNEKISLCGETTATAQILGFKWDAAQAEEFLGDDVFDWSLDDRKIFCELAHKCGNIATIKKMKADKRKLTDASYLELVDNNKETWTVGIGVLASRPTAPTTRSDATTPVL